jgi:hypothetical protein
MLKRRSCPPARHGLVAIVAPMLWLATALAWFALPASGAQIALTWVDNSTDEDGFTVERATGAGSYSAIATVSANTTTYTDTTVSNATTYNYRVRAYNNAGNSGYSNTATVTTTSPTNNAPTISNISSRTINEDANTGAVAFTVGDVETAAGSLTVSRSSSNTSLVPTANITFGGSGASRTVTVTPAANQSGSATITVTVSDGSLTASDTFTLTVSAVNDAPTISNVSNRAVARDSNTGAIAFTVGDIETAAASLMLSRASSNTSLVPTSAIVFGGSGANRTVTVTPAAGLTGTATITLTVSDGAASAADTFVLTVNPPGSSNQPPTISSIPAQTGSAGGSIGPIGFTIADSDTAASSLTVSAASSNLALVPVAGVTLGGSGTSRTLSIVPTSGQTGTATITLTVSDGTTETSTSFVVTVAGPPATVARMLNLSTRVLCRPAQEALIPGFVIGGASAKRVLLRAVGPTLGAAPFNVPGALPNPRITLKRWNGSAFVDVANNDNWATNANASEIRQVADSLLAFSIPDNSLDAVLLLDLAPGQYTVLADDAAGGQGVVILELYDADASSDGSSFINMSNRGYVGTGSQVMISGFVVSSEAPKTLLVRAVGPTLGAAPYNVANTVSDPIIEIYRRNSDGTDTLIRTHDNWGESGDGAAVAQIAQQVSAFPLQAGSKDAAFVDEFAPGVYTAVVRGVNNATGTALVEVYAVE